MRSEDLSKDAEMKAKTTEITIHDEVADEVFGEDVCCFLFAISRHVSLTLFRFGALDKFYWHIIHVHKCKGPNGLAS